MRIGIRLSAALLTLGIAAAGCASGGHASARGHHGAGGTLASYYADYYQGRKTADGEVFDQGKLTAAHRSLPFGTIVRVTNLENGKSVTVRINDRGPYVAGRAIDLSKAAARKIDMMRDGVVPVKLEVIGRESTVARAE